MIVKLLLTIISLYLSALKLNTMMKTSFANQIKSDLPASILVFFVALPLCLGIALASGAPLFSGLIAGIVGGIIVGALSGSKIGVSGPAAGLAAIVLTSIGTLGGFENFLVAVVIGGIIQLIFGFLKAGVIGYYFPSSVIKGMLTGIGIIIILKQIPHFFGYDANPAGDFSFLQMDGETTFSDIFNMVNFIQPGSALIGIIALAILILWENVLSKKAKIFKLVQGPLVAVVAGIAFYVLTKDNSVLGIASTHLVSVPVPEDFASLAGLLTFPNVAALANPEVWVVAFTIALVASLETLLCVEATDKLDPHKNVTPTNRELLAQGTGNIVSGLIGGLPITQVIVRSSANIQSGGSSKISAIVHGFFLLISVVLIPNLLNMIPLSVLAAILLVVGFKLAKPALFKTMYNLGWKQFVPFIVTVGGIIFTDLLVGIGMGLLVGVIVILYKSYQNSHFLHKEGEDIDDGRVKMTLAEEVTFFNKGAILKELDRLPEDSTLELDVTNTKYIDNDVVEILDDFMVKAEERNINIELISQKGRVLNPESYFHFFNQKKTAS
jgi:MFS superfamily sulfate permease-like transporter